MNDLREMIVIVTGSTSGIGKASAIRFAAAGAVVIVTGRNEEKGNEIVREIREHDGRAEYCKMDVRKKESVFRVMDFVAEKYGRINALFNNAGIVDLQGFLDIDYNIAQNCIDTNFWGIVYACQACIPYLIRSKGVILNNASICGLSGYTDSLFVYSAVKAAVIKLTQGIAKQYCGKIRVNAICPGSVETSICDEFNYDEIAKSMPCGRVGRPDEIAAAANFLISSDASFVTGL